MASALSAPHFHNEEAAFAYVEARVWPEGPICPHCGGFDRIGKMQGKSTRAGLYKCYQCRKPFTVRIGTIFESSHVALHIWLQAMYLIAGSKKGISANQLHRTLGVTLKTAWFMSHRIREAMRSGGFSPFGTDGGAVEADETYIGTKKGRVATRGGYNHKMQVLSLVDRNSGQVRSFTADQLSAAVVHPIIRANIAKEARLMTDEARMYSKIGKEFAEHGTTLHGIGQYVIQFSSIGLAFGDSVSIEAYGIGDTLPVAASLANVGLAIRPLPPCHLNVKFDSGQNMQISWMRRSRLDRGWHDYADLPIDEPQLAFDVQIESGPTLLATIQLQSENLEISNATFGSWGLSSGAPLTISVQQRGAYAVSAKASMSIILP